MVMYRSAGALAMRHPYVRYARMASTAWRYRKPAAKATRLAARVIQRAWRHRKGRMRKRQKRENFSPVNIGKPAGQAICKRSLLSLNGLSQMSSKTMTSLDISQIDRGTIDLNDRARNVIYMAGFKICMEVMNMKAVPMYFNLAFVSPKNSNQTSASGATLELKGFWRDTSTGREINFPGGLSPRPDSLTFRCTNINTDRFTILRHTRYTLGPNDGTSTGFNALSGKNYMSVKKWIKIRRYMTYEDDNNTARNPVWMCMWCSAYGEDEGVAPAADSVRFNYRIVRYFREPKD